MFILIAIDLIFYYVDFAKEHINSLNVLLTKKYSLRMPKKIINEG
jgi:hypothetical protein